MNEQELPEILKCDGCGNLTLDHDISEIMVKSEIVSICSVCLANLEEAQ